VDRDHPRPLRRNQNQDHWKAAFSIVVNPPTDERMARINPLGIYVTNANWGKVLQ
jgi:type IV secretory pathway TrbF-like protein